MTARAVDTHENTKIDAQPFWIRSSTVHTPVISWQATDLGNDALSEGRHRMGRSDRLLLVPFEVASHPGQ